MPFALRSGLFCRRFDADYVFFDLTADRYFLVTGILANHMQRFQAGHANAAECEELAAANLISAGPALALPNLVLPHARSSLVDTGLEAAPFRTTLAALWAQRLARRDLCREPIADITQNFRSRDDRPLRFQEWTAIEIAAAFHRARRYSSALDQCLVRGCQTAFKRDPRSASKRDPLFG